MSGQISTKHPAARRRRRSSPSLLLVVVMAIIFMLAFHWWLILQNASHASGRPILDSMYSARSKSNDSTGRNNSKGGDGTNSNGEPYILSSVCGGCYRAYRGRSPCFDLIERHQRKEKNGTTPLLDAMRYVGKIPECNMCDPDTCYKRHVDGDDAHNDQNTEKNRVKLFKYWRFDQVPLHYNVAAGLVLPSIPDRLRVPPSRFRDVEAYIRELYANPDPKNTSNSFLSEYNPSLAVIPAGMKSSLPRHAKYIASMRVSPNIHCFPREIEDALEDDIKQTSESFPLDQSIISRFS